MKPSKAWLPAPVARTSLACCLRRLSISSETIVIIWPIESFLPVSTIEHEVLVRVQIVNSTFPVVGLGG